MPALRYPNMRVGNKIVGRRAMSPDLKLVNKVGPWVEGTDFWDREAEVAALKELLLQGENVLLVAPRRVGKTSLVKETLRQLAAEEKCIGVYVDVQHCRDVGRAIVELALAASAHLSLRRRVVDAFSSVFGKAAARIEELGVDEFTLKLREGVGGDWQGKARRIHDELAKAELPVVVCFDELAKMVSHLLRGDDGEITPERRRTADEFLSWLRMAAGKHQGRTPFVVCGSIGLEPIVAQAGLSLTIAHLHPLQLGPFSRDAADGCLRALAANKGIDLADEVRGAMLDLLSFYVPHHVQMFFGLLSEDCRMRKSQAIGIDDVSRVYEQGMLGARGHADLMDYEERLLRVLGPELRPLALDLLSEAATVGRLTPKASSVLADDACLSASAPRDALRTILDVLQHDGYLQVTRNGSYVFVSHLLRDWWKRRFRLTYVRAAKRAREGA
jgi:hypothetical protein